MPRAIPDTQPTLPAVPLAPNVSPEADEGGGGPGCWLWGLLAVAGVLASVGIVALSGLAGYTNGQRIVGGYATATLSAFVDHQVSTWLPRDIASGNTELVAIRLEALASLTPGVPAVPALAASATALMHAQQTTPTPTNAPTTTPAPTDAAPPTADAPAPPTSASGGYDLAALLAEAQSDVNTSQYERAADTLDLIMALDASYRPTEVRALMFTALSTWARTLYRGNQLAQAITVTNRAERYGNINTDANPLGYERYVAGLYLNAQARIGTDYPGAIRALREVYAANPNYADVGQQLFRAYRSYGDALAAGGDPCSAVPQYTNALGVLQSSEVSGRLAAAQNACALASQPPTPDPFAPPPDPNAPPPGGELPPMGAPGG